MCVYTCFEQNRLSSGLQRVVRSSGAGGPNHQPQLHLGSTFRREHSRPFQSHYTLASGNRLRQSSHSGREHLVQCRCVVVASCCRRAGRLDHRRFRHRESALAFAARGNPVVGIVSIVLVDHPIHTRRGLHFGAKSMHECPHDHREKEDPKGGRPACGDADNYGSEDDRSYHDQSAHGLPQLRRMSRSAQGKRELVSSDGGALDIRFNALGEAGRSCPRRTAQP